MYYNKTEINDLYQITKAQGEVKPHKPINSLNNRLKAVIICLSLIGAIICGRIFWMNFISDGFYTEQSDMRIKRNIEIPPVRGQVFDRNGDLLALSAPVNSIWIDPEELKDIDIAQLKLISSILGLSVSSINEKLKLTNSNFVYLARNIAPEVSDKIMALKIPGVYRQKSFKRFYPNGEVSAQIVGLNNIDQNGVSGFELLRDKDLKGVAGNEEYIRDPKGNVIENLNNIVEAVNGNDVHLSIDSKIQYIAYSELKNAVARLNAKSASAVVLDAKTGQVLAMASYPSYNPNLGAPKDISLMKNASATDLYEPGSTMKPILIAKALDAGLIKPTTVFDTRPYYIDKKLIQDTHLYPSLDVTGIVQKSSDVGTSKIAFMLDKKQMSDYFARIGFGNKKYTELPGASKGTLLNYNRWSKLDQASMSYGYAINVSLLQMATAYTMFTNNGCLIAPSFYNNSTPDSCEQILSPNTVMQMNKMLASVTEKGGTAEMANVDNYTVAGKTGTAHKSSKNGYSANSYIGSFIGYAPTKNPRLIVAVMVDDPKSGRSYFGGTSAAPVFSNIVAQSLPYLEVPYDKFK